jgi:hypothetical protein
MSDDFPLMPTRQCPDCDAPKKVMFFPKRGAYCTKHANERSRAARERSGRYGGITPGFEFNQQPIGTGRAS